MSDKKMGSKMRFHRATEATEAYASKFYSERDFQAWAYSNETYFEIDGRIIKLTADETDKLFKFLRDQRAKDRARG